MRHRCHNAFAVIAVLDMGQSMASGQAMLLLLVPWMAVAPAASAAPAPAPPPAPAAATDWPPGAPVAAAVLVHRGERCRLALADLVHGTHEDLGPADEDVEPVWSPDGTQLAYISGSTLTVLRPGKGPAIRMRGGLTPQRWPQHAFSPDGQLLAVGTPKSLEIYSLGETAERVVAAPSKLILSSLTWAQDGQQLVACQWNGDHGPRSRESLAIYSLEGTTIRTRVLRASFRGCQIFGLRNGLWLARHRDEHGGEEVLAVSREGKLARLLRLPSDYYAQAYLSARDAIAAGEGTEDNGPTPWALLSLSDKRQRPFLRKFRHIHEVRANEDGSYVLVNVPSEREDPFGRVFISATDGTFSRQVLPAPGSKSKNSAFSNPVPRPLPRVSP
jgi:hypothetical protein